MGYVVYVIINALQQAALSALQLTECMLQCNSCFAEPDRSQNSFASEASLHTLGMLSLSTVVAGSRVTINYTRESPEQLTQAQMTDDILRTVIEWLERSHVKPKWEEAAPSSEYTKAYWTQWDSLQLINGVLHLSWETPSGNATLRQLVVPASLREKFLQELHGSVTAGHFGIAKTCSAVLLLGQMPR